MSGLAYRADWLAARERLTTWWNGGDIGRAAMQLFVPREEPVEEWEVPPAPEGWLCAYSTLDLEHHVRVRLPGVASQYCLGEAVAATNAGDLAPNCLALYQGCHGLETDNSCWCEPFLEDLESADFGYDADNFYWNFTQAAIRRSLELGRGKFLQVFPDLIEGLDTLAAARGTQNLLFDLIMQPEQVHRCLRQITDVYFHYYDMIYDLIRDEVGGSVFWAWAPGRLAKLQCDFAAMISPEMFEEFMGPVLRHMTERVSYSLYHWDGPQAIPDKATLFNLPNLDCIQWQPGAGNAPIWDPCWFPIYHEAFDAGKKMMLSADSREHLRNYKREFGDQCKQMIISGGTATVAEAEEWIKIMEE
ncbi:MAG TPA: hypothetical protein VGM19_12545 [Armatimonadota bacterium]|jgi:5-methyltetrahydrofolate--homocysteine methyltransferase